MRRSSAHCSPPTAHGLGGARPAPASHLCPWPRGPWAAPHSCPPPSHGAAQALPAASGCHGDTWGCRQLHGRFPLVTFWGRSLPFSPFLVSLGFSLPSSSGSVHPAWPGISLLSSETDGDRNGGRDGMTGQPFFRATAQTGRACRSSRGTERPQSQGTCARPHARARARRVHGAPCTRKSPPLAHGAPLRSRRSTAGRPRQRQSSDHQGARQRRRSGTRPAPADLTQCGSGRAEAGTGSCRAARPWRRPRCRPFRRRERRVGRPSRAS